MKTASFSTLLLALCLLACRQDYTPKQLHLVADGISQTVPGSLVSREFFARSGAKPLLGGFSVPAEFQPSRSAVAVLSYKIWQDSFHSHPEVIGSTIQLDGRAVTIVGVAAPGFAPSGSGDLWIPAP